VKESSVVNYEHAREIIESVPVSPNDGSRILEWIGFSETVGVARDHAGRTEILLRGPELAPSSGAVKAASDYRLVYRDNGSVFEATRLVFPALAHFDQVVAFICVELLRNGADIDLSVAFRRTEPIIQLAISDLALTRQALVGLAGELLLLEALCRRADDARVAEVVAGWFGWQRSSRDFVLGRTGIEVKTTTRNASSHLVEGVHQVERDEDEEDRLLLVSIGLQQTENHAGNSFTVPSLVDRIISRMVTVGLPLAETERFIARVAEYGAGSSIGYDHAMHAADPVYASPFLTTFVRAYDMSDAAIGVLRRQDIAALHHVVDGSVRFRVNLSATGVISAGNPISGANQVAQAIFEP
jgi:hypothetical protein